MVSKKMLKVNPTHSIMTELKKEVLAVKSNTTVMDLIWLLSDASLLTSGFDLERTITLYLRVVDDEGLGDDDDPPLQEVD